ncbi:hypothetical protein Q5P01_004810 [Channa striata]|uniref:Uncharacterized protein n=1 Tax=Channa striata TaxID=64152 RepID=A0AA88T0Q1_CHASR|nr:hypothetical protein Q5P01_004810 [Channa striata]
MTDRSGSSSYTVLSALRHLHCTAACLLIGIGWEEWIAVRHGCPLEPQNQAKVTHITPVLPLPTAKWEKGSMRDARVKGKR